MKKYYKIIYGLVIIVILGLVFYWFQWRPVQIGKECKIWVSEKAKGVKLSASAGLDLLNFCMKEHGL